ncbi:MAG: hypothetical protein JJ975_17040, partial [Bacteroidia bacterium]|nr:hypothetical protein [Bacteroidia bacterium]
MRNWLGWLTFGVLLFGTQLQGSGQTVKVVDMDGYGIENAVLHVYTQASSSPEYSNSSGNVDISKHPNFDSIVVEHLSYAPVRLSN